MTKKSGEEAEWWALTRRDFLKAAGIGAVALATGWVPGKNEVPIGKPTLAPADDDPIATLADGPAARQFFGDEVQRFHAILWDKANTISARGGLPKSPSEKARVCIIGGGLAGLSTAWLLKQYQPVVLEGATRLGGNAKGRAGVTSLTASVLPTSPIVLLKMSTCRCSSNWACKRVGALTTPRTTACIWVARFTTNFGLWNRQEARQGFSRGLGLFQTRARHCVSGHPI
jgi:hypothetical protein